MDSVTLARLRATGAPVAPLDTTKRQLIKSRTGKIWHRDPALGPNPSWGSTMVASCARGLRTARKLDHEQMTATVAAAVETGLELCQAFGCGEHDTTAEIATRLAAAVQAAAEFDDAVGRDAWVAARAAADRLGRLGTLSDEFLRRHDPRNATVEDLRAAAAWCAHLHTVREPLVATTLAGFRDRVMQAAAASEVRLDRQALAAVGLDWPTGSHAFTTWVERTELMDPPAGVSLMVTNAIQVARRASRGLPAEQVIPEPVVVEQLVTGWAAQAAAHPEIDREPSVAVIGPAVEPGRKAGATVVGWRSMAAQVFPTVHRNDSRPATATLVPRLLADRIRAAYLTETLALENRRTTRQPEIAVIDDVPADRFVALAETALGLWDRDQATNPLTDPVVAWQTAEAACR